jgi:hypothetical protein
MKKYTVTIYRRSRCEVNASGISEAINIAARQAGAGSPSVPEVVSKVIVEHNGELTTVGRDGTVKTTRMRTKNEV